MITGTGNGTRDHTGRRAEGVLTDRVVGTYLHGPVLARNPALADHLLTAITGTEMAPLELPDQAALRRTYLSPRAARRIHHRRRIPRSLTVHDGHSLDEGRSRRHGRAGPSCRANSPNQPWKSRYGSLARCGSASPSGPVTLAGSCEIDVRGTIPANVAGATLRSCASCIQAGPSSIPGPAPRRALPHRSTATKPIPSISSRTVTRP